MLDIEKSGYYHNTDQFFETRKSLILRSKSDSLPKTICEGEIVKILSNEETFSVLYKCDEFEDYSIVFHNFKEVYFEKNEEFKRNQILGEILKIDSFYNLEIEVYHNSKKVNPEVLIHCNSQ